MILLEKIGLICGLVIIFIPVVVFTTAMIMDAIYSYFDDKWVKGRTEGEDKC